MSKRFVVTRTVTTRQAIVLKANTEEEAIELSRKQDYKKWSTENAQRSGYSAMEFES